MKAIISYLLLTVFLFNILGYVVVFKISQIQIKKEVKRELKSKIKHSELHLISFNQNDFDQINWFEEGKEFILNNKMYDIVKTETSENLVLLYCIDDKQEAQLFSNLDEHINKHIANQQSKSKNKSKSVDDHQKIAHFIDLSLKQRFAFKLKPSFIYKTLSIEFVLSSNTPPPELL
ncbi:MAG: hypothetical protein JNL24_08560 [Bacteroidia bacterium]|nr:hypothetical protein [Bacteroidia bacterium]